MQHYALIYRINKNTGLNQKEQHKHTLTTIMYSCGFFNTQKMQSLATVIKYNNLPEYMKDKLLGCLAILQMVTSKIN